MKRTTALGNDTNRYTEGNPSLGVPATVVGAQEMNNIQEEIANAVEGAGLTVDQTGVTENQLVNAILLLIQGGGTQTTFAIANNTGPSDVTGLVFDKVNVRGARVLFHLERRTDTQNVAEIGELYPIYNPESDTWDIGASSHGDDAGVAFTITAAGQIQYTSDDLTGASYTGNIRFTSITTLAT
jgi:hypothetical protein